MKRIAFLALLLGLLLGCNAPSDAERFVEPTVQRQEIVEPVETDKPTAPVPTADKQVSEAPTQPPPATATPIPVATETAIPTPSAEIPTESPPTEASVNEGDAQAAAAPTAEAPAGAQPAASISPAVVGPQAPVVFESTITIPTYGYEAAFVNSAEDDPIYPYPRLDHGQVSPPSPKPYRAIVLENGYVSVTVLPELGGRVYSWRDKSTGRELLYQNPVIKPTSWGYRGWWLAAGGIEWAFPVEEHGLNEWQPWDAQISNDGNRASVSVSSREARTGMQVGATISLDAGHAYLTLQPWATNDTDQSHPYQLWLNAMLTLGDNTTTDQLQFVVPNSEVIVHSTADGGAAPSGAAMSWPVHNGRDMSWYSGWTGYLGFFISTEHGFVGMYDHGRDQGIVRAHSPNWPSGAKIFGPATLSPDLWTDDGSRYVELWSGATGSFWHYVDLEPGQTVGWTEVWYPIHGMGGFDTANQRAALKFQHSGVGLDIGVAVSSYVDGQVVLLQNGTEVGRWPLQIGPSQAFRTTWPVAFEESTQFGLQLISGDGTLVAQAGNVP